MVRPSTRAVVGGAHLSNLPQLDALWPDRNARRRQSAACRAHRPDDARPGVAAAAVAPLRRRRACSVRDRSLRRSASSSGGLTASSIRVAIFTTLNLVTISTTTATMDAYWDAIGRTVRPARVRRRSSINLDDDRGTRPSGRPSRAPAFYVAGPVDCLPPSALHAQWAQEIGYGERGLRLLWCEGAERHCWRLQVIGQYNVSNSAGR